MTTSSADGTAHGVDSYRSAPSSSSFKTCVIYMLGYPGMGKRTVGGHLATLLDGVLVDNALINRPLLELFRWDGVEQLPPRIWERAVPIQEAVLATIEDLAPSTNSYVFTNVIEAGPTAAEEYDRVRSLAHRRESLFLSVMLTCDIEAQVSRIDNPDRIALRKGADPQGYRGHRLSTSLYQPPAAEVIHIDTTQTPPADNAEHILNQLCDRGYVAATGASLQRCSTDVSASASSVPVDERPTPVLLLMTGLPGSGKTTRARELERQYNAVRFTPDEWMIPLFGEPEPGSTRSILEGRLVWTATRVLRAGSSVILDFGLWGRDERQALRALAISEGIPCQVVYFPIDYETQRLRTRHRSQNAPATTFEYSDEDLQRQQAQYQVPEQNELDGEPVGPPPTGYASWAAWTVKRWPTAYGHPDPSF